MVPRRSRRSRQQGAYFAPPLPRILAHRGLALDQPENTLSAFRAAVDAGADYVELDVHASRDGEAIVAHDPTLTRLLGRDDHIAGLSAAYLRSLDLGDGAGFQTLGDVLEALPLTRFNIDIKALAAVGPTVRAVKATGAVDRVLITSFSEKRRRAAVRRLPGVATSASARGFVLALLASKAGLTSMVRHVLRAVDAVQVPERALGLRVTTPKVLASIHAAGVEMHVWTVNDPSVMRELLQLGVDGLVTDRADLGLGVAAGLAQ
ncbi:glycerophosphodiester phosphodiesterase family protein [Subtercola frigoramans]|uniref:Glycerophosphoryl diester phosphodiesterase n=1 Tax=Subtercola frigoramans TaxID=120298 RepID=A0ABS2L5B9_9MICO|nr:glycerophosphodiester phosphodiesterase family protein [Subtercola frigoramans]MBM7472302.1 glycerophosphoryl diester phosphodiesterase [Subtercola frigoramans]